jgi:hypothetical protein
LWSRAEQKNAKIRPPLGITTKSDFVFAQPGPIAEAGGPNVVRCEISYSITSSALSKIDRGTVSPSALAVLMLTAVSNLVGS